MKNAFFLLPGCFYSKCCLVLFPGLNSGKILKRTMGKGGRMATRVSIRCWSPSSSGGSKRTWRNPFLPKWNRSSGWRCLLCRSSITSKLWAGSCHHRVNICTKKPWDSQLTNCFFQWCLNTDVSSSIFMVRNRKFYCSCFLTWVRICTALFTLSVVWSMLNLRANPPPTDTDFSLIHLFLLCCSFSHLLSLCSVVGILLDTGSMKMSGMCSCQTCCFGGKTE